MYSSMYSSTYSKQNIPRSSQKDVRRVVTESSDAQKDVRTVEKIKIAASADNAFLIICKSADFVLMSTDVLLKKFVVLSEMCS